jgi:hypothetical protein
MGAPYDDDNHTEPPQSLVQCPDPVADECLDNERNRRIHRWTVYWRVVVVPKAVHIAESYHEPTVGVDTSQGSLDGLQEEDEVGWAEVSIN